MHLLPAPGHAALRRGRVSVPGQIYHLTLITAARRPWFASFGAARIAARLLNASRVLGASQTLCWVAMPDHLHWLVQLGDDRTLQALVGRFKSVSALAMHRRFERHALTPVWARAFHDHALRDEEDVETLARYIVGNPIRAGLCMSELDYPHWDCVWDWGW